MLRRREFGLLMRLGFTGSLTNEAQAQTRPNTLDAYFANILKQPKMSSTDFSYGKKLFLWNNQYIPINTERFCFVDYDSDDATSFTFSNKNNSNQTSLGTLVFTRSEIIKKPQTLIPPTPEEKDENGIQWV